MAFDLNGKAVKSLRLSTYDYSNIIKQVIHAQYGDLNSRFLEVQLFDERGTIKLASSYNKAMFCATLPNGEAVVKELPEKCLDYENNVIIFPLTKDVLKQVGKVACDVRLINAENNACLTSKTFWLHVHESQYNPFGDMVSDDIPSEFDDLKERVDTIETNIANGSVFDGAFRFCGNGKIKCSDKEKDTIQNLYGDSKGFVAPEWNGEIYSIATVEDTLGTIKFVLKTGEEVEVSSGDVVYLLEEENESGEFDCVLCDQSKNNRKYVEIIKGEIYHEVSSNSSPEKNYDEIIYSVDGSDFAKALHSMRQSNLGGAVDVTEHYWFVFYEKLDVVENSGAVYTVGNIEYVSDGTKWIKLGSEHSNWSTF